MDQESFRRLLQTPRPAGSSTPGLVTNSRGFLVSASTSKQKTLDASQPAFKPRKVKKSTDSKYRDRAAERRVGEGNDYAQVEAVLEDFEKRAANDEDKNAVEEQRQYLGGDGDHSILVKGLDVALLEQNKARAALSTEDDDSLEQAFLETASTVPKKRTREDLIKELKMKREQNGGIDGNTTSIKTAEDEARLLDEAKKKGKFKPIGAPVEKEKKKKLKVTDNTDERKKKKRKVVAKMLPPDSKEEHKITKSHGEMLPPPIPAIETPPSVPVPSSSTIAEPEPEETVEDFDIFAGAGEYDGFDLGDDDGDDEHQPETDVHTGVVGIGEDLPSAKPKPWIPLDEEENATPENQQTLLSTSQSHSPREKAGGDEISEGELEEQSEQSMRLAPLASSALPSIKEFLAMDKAAGAAAKNRKRKEKKKGGKNDDEDTKKRNAEVKADRDYKRLKSYTDKKAGDSSTK